MWCIGIMLMSYLVLDAAELKENNFVKHLKIVNGKEATVKKYPFAVQLQNKATLRTAYKNKCGGTLITSRHVLTAAHCLSNYHPYCSNSTEDLELYTPSEMFARVGTDTLNIGGSLHQGSEIRLHPDTIKKKLTTDIGVLLLATAVTYSSMVQPAPIPRHGVEIPVKSKAQIIGWGRIDSIIASEDGLVLQEATITLRGIDECNLLLDSESAKKLFCAWEKAGASTCFGDSGGPVVFKGVVIGITSGGHGGKCVSCHPTLYTKVSAYSKWIKHVVWRSKIPKIYKDLYNASSTLTYEIIFICYIGILTMALY